MFATPICETTAHKWPLETSSPSYSKLPRPRMSDPYGIGLPTKPSWPEEGMYLQSTETSHPQHLFTTTQDSLSDKGHSDGAANNQGGASQNHSIGDFHNSSHAYDQSSSRFRTRTSPSAPSIMTDSAGYRGTTTSDPFWRNRLDTRIGLGVLGQHGVSSTTGPSVQTSMGHVGHGEVEEYSDDGDGGEGESDGIQQTAAERLASRRKMKRFRLTHQQTRFLMSEFAKQPHPDAAHRDRLSREIPGLSPRQVQVWFQNRRAKIKRLNADDRERVVQMRAVPENFDNIQALHSPYGAVPAAYDGSMQQASGHGQQHMYGPQHPRPLLVDVRRTEGEPPMQSTGLTPIFGGIGFGQGHVSGMLDTTPILSSPSGFGSNDRYTYGPRQPTAGVTETKGSAASSPIIENDHRSHPRPLRPAGLTDPMSRGRSVSLQSGMGSSMYWRGSGLGDVAEVQDLASEHGSEGHQPSLHTSTSGMGLGNVFYGGEASTHPPTAAGDMAAIHQDQLRRNRAASATFPLDSRSQYSEMSQQSILSPIRPDAPRPVASSHAGSTYTPGYTSSPSFPGSMSLPNARLLESRDHVPQYGYNSGDSSGTTAQTFPITSQAANEDEDPRSFFQETPPVHYERQGEALPYNETAEAADTVKRE